MQDRDLFDAAYTVLTTCLQSTEPALLIFDQHGLPLADAFIEASQTALPHGLTALYVSRDQQAWCVTQRAIPPSLEVAIAKSKTLITALTADESCTWFRAATLEFAKTHGLRILHLPGVDEELLIKAIVNVDFEAVQEYAMPIHETLAHGEKLDIETVDGDGKRHLLRAVISGRHPHICGGVALPREIMNLPTGEVYIAPIEEESNGTLVLGTTGERVLKSRGDQVVLAFNNGQLDLDNSVFSSAAISRAFHQELKSIKESDPNNTVLCEIGVGLNPKVWPLTGNEIWDEKAFGTAHIALANKMFGGNIHVNFHRDLVFFPSAIRVDGQELLVAWRQAGRTRPAKAKG